MSLAIDPRDAEPEGELIDYGWTDAVAAAFAPFAVGANVPARVVAGDRGSYLVATADGEVRAQVGGRFRYEAGDDPAAFPAVGDWVVLDAENGIITGVVPRRTSLVRHAPGRQTVAQVVAANVDVVFVVASLNQDLNPRRLERYLAVAWESGAEPIVVLSKADLADDVDDLLAEIEAIAVGVPVLTVSAFDGRGIAEVRARVAPGTTVAFVGSSGVGKSTLLNKLAGADVAAVREIRRDDAKGRHTTTRRQLHLLPEGGLVLDTPGMRELALWDADAGLERSFADIEALAEICRFSDCAHNGEPGCAVTSAIADGDLAESRFQGWRKLEREARHLERRVDALARAEERRKWKSIHKSVGVHMDFKYGREGR
ncbi:MAG TPA: ribosome small subunit-dependent GTPase A [Candidatus Limnocylindrales bacterium]|nr:ribosome small subunit-dependent GTPase A [Candidatus Limnocylindrales bacterium]